MPDFEVSLVQTGFPPASLSALPQHARGTRILCTSPADAHSAGTAPARTRPGPRNPSLAPSGPPGRKGAPFWALERPVSEQEAARLTGEAGDSH